MEEKDLTIIIPTLNNELSVRALKFCLASLKDTCSCDVKIAPNGEGTIFKQGQCGAVNRVAKEVTTPWLMISNNDMVFSPCWFKEMSYWMENMGLLVASPNLVEPRKGAPPFLEHFCGGIGTEGTEPDFNKQCFLDFAKNYNPLEPSSYSGKIPVEDGLNLPFVIRKEVWDTVGGYDENYDPWGSCSDTHLQTKLMIAGIIPKRIMSALVYHFSQTSGTFHPDRQSFREKNWRYYEDFWGFPAFKNPEVWYKPEIPYEKLKYHPEWEGKYAK